MDKLRRRALLVRQEYDVHGVTLQVWEHEDEAIAVSKLMEERAAKNRHCIGNLWRSVYVFHMRWSIGATSFSAASSTICGRVCVRNAEPCVRCNERVKLHSLYALAQERGMDYVATGHYARSSQAGGVVVASGA